MKISQTQLVAIFVLSAIVGGIGFLFLAVSSADKSPSVATVLPQPVALPEFALLDEQGQGFNRESFLGQWSLVFFGFTHCPDICPATLQQLSLARDRMIAGGVSNIPQIVLISVDPDRDTPDTMRAYTSHFGSGIKGVSGDIDQLRKLTSTIGVYFAKSDQNNDNYNVDHSTVVLLVNPRSEFHAVFSSPHMVDNFAADVPLMTDAS